MKKKITLLFFIIICTLSIDAQITSVAYNVSTPVGSNISGIPKWTSSSTWVGGVKPAPGDVVNIPANSAVVLNENVNLAGITINGKLIIDIRKNVIFRSSYIMVRGSKAYLEWGTEAEPYLNNGRIELYGNNPSATIPGTTMNRKMLVAMGGGQIELHGEPKKSWTQLGETADIDTRAIVLKQNVDWEIGDEIVIASTDYAPENAEVVTITSKNGKNIGINKKLSYMHFGKLKSYNGGTMRMDQRAEVGLLSRNLKIVGTPVYGGNAGFNASVMIMDGSQAHIEGVEFNTVGQKGLIGRYPLHWHLGGDINGQYIKNSSIRQSSNRAVVVHGTSKALIEGVVAYDHVGHGFMLEDGDEEENIFKDNLGILTKNANVADALEPEEAKEAATFWITNPNNRFIGNAAAGSEGSGFWLIPVTRVLRAGAKPNSYSPRKFPLLEFDGNRAHSNSKRGIMIEGDMKRSDRSVTINNQHPLLDVNGDTLRHVFRNFTTFKSRNCIWTRGSVNNIFINGSVGEGNFMAFLSFNALVRNTLFVARNENTGPENYHKPGLQILGAQMYNGSTDFRNIHLADFDEPNEICIGTRQSSGKYPNFTASGVTFENVPTNSRVNFNKLSDVEDPARSYSYVSGLIDIDGSISGTAGGRITPAISNTRISEPLFANRIYQTNFNLPLDTGRRTRVSEWNAFVTTGTSYAMLQNWPGWGSHKNIAIQESRFIYQMRSDGPVAFDLLRKGWDIQTPIILGENIDYTFQFHETPNTMKSQFRWTTTKDETIVAKYTNVPSATTLTNATKVNTLAQLRNSANQAFLLRNNTLHVKYKADIPDANINTSVTAFDYSAKDVEIIFNPGKPATGNDKFVTLADFEVGVDNRGSITSPGSLPFTSLTGNGSDPTDNVDNSNSFTFNRNNNGLNEIINYQMDFDRQIWREFNYINLDYTGSPVEVFVIDSNQGANSLGIYHPSNSNRIRLDLNPNQLDGVIGLRFRFRECSTTTNTTTVDFKSIKLSKEVPANYSRKLTSNCGTLPSSKAKVDKLALENDDISDIGSLKLFPNPFTNELNIRSNSNKYEKTEIKIYSLLGQLIMEKTFLNNQPLNIQTSRLDEGYYLIEINFDGIIEHKKVYKN
jgi:hypothetical protein